MRSRAHRAACAPASPDLQQALFWTWLILSTLGATAVLAALGLPERWVLSASAALQTPHEHRACALCGMTRALVAIADGRWSQALDHNRWSIFLVTAVLVSALAAIAALIHRTRCATLHRAR